MSPRLYRFLERVVAGRLDLYIHHKKVGFGWVGRHDRKGRLELARDSGAQLPELEAEIVALFGTRNYEWAEISEFLSELTPPRWPDCGRTWFADRRRDTTPDSLFG
jgi:hypothetical protein